MATVQIYEVGETVAPHNAGFRNWVRLEILEKYATLPEAFLECGIQIWRPRKTFIKFAFDGDN
jgi:hypothetical protein